MLQHIRRGNECHRCVTPEVTTIDTLTPYINRWLYFGRILAAKGQYHRSAGRYAEATEIGEVLSAVMLPAIDSLLEGKCRVESDLAATTLLVGLHTFRKDAGRWPDSLHDLVPEHLAAVPADPFDGQPFRYIPERAVLYSVGKNLEDFGGSTAQIPGRERVPPGSKRWNTEDLVYDIEMDGSLPIQEVTDGGV